jgi:CheY-like chemotaxis protein
MRGDCAYTRADFRNRFECPCLRSAARGAEALEIATANGPDVVVVDVRMPGMSGIECGWLIRERDPNSRVILISGSIFDDRRPDPTESRASAYLAKSEVAARLRATLVEVMAVPEARG